MHCCDTHPCTTLTMALLVVLSDPKSFRFFTVPNATLELAMIPVIVAEIFLVPFEGVGDENISAIWAI